MVRISTRTPSPNNVLSVGWWMLVSTTVVSTRILRPCVTPCCCAICNDPVVNLLDRVRIHSQAPTSHRLGIRRLAAAHTGEVAVNQVGAHLALQHVIAPVANVLEDQQPQHHLGRCARPTTTAAPGMSSRECLVHRTYDLLIRENPISMGHPAFAKIAHFPGDQAVAEAQLRSAHLNHVSSSRRAAPPHQRATAAD